MRRFIPTRVGQITGTKPPTLYPSTVHPHACGADRPAAAFFGRSVPVHPHACGADSQYLHQVGRPSPGSSPRVWGRCLCKSLILLPLHRFIPTRVGQIREDGTSTNILSRFIPTRVGQISLRILSTSSHQRFIPTRVGQMTFSIDSTTTARPVHPHACGADAGTPMRSPLNGRFIPTRVGQMIR